MKQPPRSFRQMTLPERPAVAFGLFCMLLLIQALFAVFTLRRTTDWADELQHRRKTASELMKLETAVAELEGAALFAVLEKAPRRLSAARSQAADAFDRLSRILPEDQSARLTELKTQMDSWRKTVVEPALTRRMQSFHPEEDPVSGQSLRLSPDIRRAVKEWATAAQTLAKRTEAEIEPLVRRGIFLIVFHTVVSVVMAVIFSVIIGRSLTASMHPPAAGGPADPAPGELAEITEALSALSARLATYTRHHRGNK